MVKRIHRDFAPVVVKSIPDLPPFFSALTFFTDIFFIVFDNIRRHSGIPQEPHVEVNVTDLVDRVRVVVRSEIAPHVKTQETQTKVDHIRESIAQGLYQRAVRLEGGTGLIKLCKILAKDPQSEKRLSFGFENESFCVDFLVPVRRSDNENTSG